MALMTHSPYTPTLNTAIAFPDRKVGDALVVRVGGTVGNGDVVLFKINGVPSSTNADIYLTNGESFEFEGCMINKASEVQMIAVTGTPPIYYLIK